MTLVVGVTVYCLRVAALTVKLVDDHLERLIKTPAQGLSELIWNALDADATRVAVTLERNGLGGIDQVTVSDNGTGMTRMEVENAFGKLGGSWKSTTGATAKGRLLHGKKGEGRFKAFGIGTYVAWNIFSTKDQPRTMTIVNGDRSSLNEFTISEPITVTNEPGTDVVVTGIPAETSVILEGERLVENLTAEFAEYLTKYPDAEISWNGNKLDVDALVDRRFETTLSVDGVDDPIELVIVEWNRSVERAIFLSGMGGIAVHRVRASIHAPGFFFTAYLKWQGFQDHDAVLGELGTEPASSIIDAARSALKSHFKDRAQERIRDTVNQWRVDGSYPYSGEATTEVERTERQIFDVVAVTAARSTDLGDVPQRKFTLGLMREALAANPTGLRTVLQSVLDLPAERVEELSNLLNRTSLSAIVTSAKKITDRLDFLESLDDLLFGDESRQRLRERTQLHRILASETWIFGEEYATTGDDESLTRVLKKYLNFLDPSATVDDVEPVLNHEGRVAIPDLVFSRANEVSADRVENLVIELKAPKVKIDNSEVVQIENYALAVMRDERFAQSNAFWDFWLIGNSLGEYAEARRQQTHLPKGYIQRTDKYAIQVRTWAEVINDARHRMKFVQRALDYEATHAAGAAYLRETHARYIPEDPEPEEAQEPISEG